MNVHIVSLFRNMSKHIERYVETVTAFDWQNWRVVAVTGDNNDDTLDRLRDWESHDKRVDVIELNLGKPYYSSCVHPERFEILGTSADAGLQLVNDQHWADYVLWLESDLTVKPDLIHRLFSYGKPVVAPMIWVELTEGFPQFYDVWAYRRNRQMFNPAPPAWYADNMPDELFEIDSAGSVLFIDAQAVYDGARFGTKEAIVSFCECCRAGGYSIWCDPHTHVRHPWPRLS